MRPIARTVLLSLVVSLGVIALAEESWAAFAGGSRLLFYYTQRSIVNPAAAPGSAATIVGITNQSFDTAVKVRVNIFNGSTCANFGPVTFDLSPRRTLRLNVGTEVTAAGFPEGWVDVYAVNAGGLPIRWDQLAGKGTILDFGGANTAAVTYEAAGLFSDDPNRTVGADTQGSLISNTSHINTFGMTEGTVEFWAPGGSFGIGDRLIVIPVSAIPGTAPAATSINSDWFKTDETQTLNDQAINTTCMVASSLASLHPAFATNYPNTDGVADGGNLSLLSLTNKGFVGALAEFGTAPVALLTVSPIQQLLGGGEETHE